MPLSPVPVNPLFSFLGDFYRVVTVDALELPVIAFVGQMLVAVALFADFVSHVILPPDDPERC